MRPYWLLSWAALGAGVGFALGLALFATPLGLPELPPPASLIVPGSSAAARAHAVAALVLVLLLALAVLPQSGRLSRRPGRR